GEPGLDLRHGRVGDRGAVGEDDGGDRLVAVVDALHELGGVRVPLHVDLSVGDALAGELGLESLAGAAPGGRVDGERHVRRYPFTCGGLSRLLLTREESTVFPNRPLTSAIRRYVGPYRRRTGPFTAARWRRWRTLGPASPRSTAARFRPPRGCGRARCCARCPGPCGPSSPRRPGEAAPATARCARAARTRPPSGRSAWGRRPGSRARAPPCWPTRARSRPWACTRRRA